MIKVLSCSILLLYASILDWRYREIDDKAWLSMLLLGLLFLIYDFFKLRDASLIVLFSISVGIAVPIAALLSYLKVMGGGDAKILVGIAALIPTLNYSTVTVFPFFMLGVFFGNAVPIGALLPLVFFTINLKHLPEVGSLKGFLALFLGYEKEASRVGKFEALLGRNGNYTLLVKKDELGKKIEGGGKVWVTPAIPFVILITIGFVISVVYGDLLSYILLSYFS